MSTAKNLPALTVKITDQQLLRRLHRISEFNGNKVEQIAMTGLRFNSRQVVDWWEAMEEPPSNTKFRARYFTHEEEVVRVSVSLPKLVADFLNSQTKDVRGSYSMTIYSYWAEYYWGLKKDRRLIRFAKEKTKEHVEVSGPTGIVSFEMEGRLWKHLVEVANHIGQITPLALVRKALHARTVQLMDFLWNQKHEKKQGPIKDRISLNGPLGNVYAANIWILPDRYNVHATRWKQAEAKGDHVVTRSQFERMAKDLRQSDFPLQPAAGLTGNIALSILLDGMRRDQAKVRKGGRRKAVA